MILAQTRPSLLLITILLITGCFGPVDPTHPLDRDTPIEGQRRASISLQISVPTEVEMNGYLTLRSSESQSESQRLYFEDFAYQGNVTESDGSAWALYRLNINQIVPGIYALHSMSSDLQLNGQLLFELLPGSEITLELTLKPK